MTIATETGTETETAVRAGVNLVIVTEIRTRGPTGTGVIVTGVCKPCLGPHGPNWAPGCPVTDTVQAVASA